MGRGYWLPPGADKLAACDGFYIQGDAIYKSDFSKDWDTFLQNLCNGLCFKDRSFLKICAWETCGFAENRFVVLKNKYIDIVADDSDGDIAVYALIPENCRMKKTALKVFPEYLSVLKTVLTELYPNKVYRRKNARVTEPVD